MDLPTGAMLGDEELPDGRMQKWLGVTLMRGCRRVCQSGSRDGQKDGRNRGRFLYSD